MTTTNTPLGDEGMRTEIARLLKPAAFDDRFPERKAHIWGSTGEAAEYQAMLRKEALAKADRILALLASFNVGGAVGVSRGDIARAICRGEGCPEERWPEYREAADQVAELFSAAPDQPPVEQPSRCDFCGREKTPVSEGGYCAPPFQVQRHSFTGKHPSHAVEQPSIPAGMVAFGPDHPDYPDGANDWDGGPALRRSGDCFTPGNGKASPYWQHDGDPKDIIAYRPKPSEQPTVRVEVLVNAIRPIVLGMVDPSGRDNFSFWLEDCCKQLAEAALTTLGKGDRT